MHLGPEAPGVLVVDLDETLVKTDLLLEGLLWLLRRQPLSLLGFPRWLLGGKASLKREVAIRARLDYARLPYAQPVLDLIEQQRSRGGTVVLATAAHRLAADAVAAHLGCFDAVLATDAGVNLSGDRKRAAIEQWTAGRPFDYAADGWVDLAVWAVARRAIVVQPKRGVLNALRGRGALEVVRTSPPRLTTWARALRPHQWLKNVLVFVPLVAAQRFVDEAAWTGSTIAFAAFCGVASGIYVLNDLIDVASDRAHPRKRRRPFAAGDLPLLHGFLSFPALLVLGLAVAALAGPVVATLIGGYAILSFAYALVLKRLVVLDTMVLAALYTARIFAGAAAAGVAPSFWLLAFSMLLFLSLAMMKRASELKLLERSGRDSASGRDYEVLDYGVITALGAACGYCSAVVLALYLHAPENQERYAFAPALWLVCPMMLYWLGRLWVKTGRGQMNDDPLVFALTDRNSLLLGAVAGALVALAMLGLPS
jgi:4-hydroxybenzoate polyprenyltransferase